METNNDKALAAQLAHLMATNTWADNADTYEGATWQLRFALDGMDGASSALLPLWEKHATLTDTSTRDIMQRFIEG